LLGVHSESRGHWREVAAHIAPYLIWQATAGPEFTDITGIEPVYLPEDHFGEAAFYPTLLADEVNLDSPQEQCPHCRPSYGQSDRCKKISL
jgi:hypothetical protein